MSFFARRAWLFSAALAMAVSTAVSADTTPPAKPPAKPAPAAKPLTEAEKAALAEYDALVTAYLQNDFDGIEKHLKDVTAQMGKLNTDQRSSLEYIRAASQQQRPKWWEKTKSSENTSFQSTIWGRNIMTNYMPADELGFQATSLEVRDGKLVTFVVWRPTQVDNPRPVEGALAKTLSVTKGDIGEVIVWHELGHLFINSQLSQEAAYELFTKYEMLYSHLQEFFGDLSAVYHSTPHARRMAMVLRLDLLDPPYGKYREIEPHTRGANAIGSMFLAEVLTDPTKWPNVHLPPKVPEGEIELKTIIYMYEHFTGEWTFAEDKAMREWALKMIKTQGDQIFRSKGMIALPDKNTFSLMEAQDRDFQKKRNAWVAAKLKVAIDAGKADKEAATQAAGKETVITVNGRKVKVRSGEEQRIEVPLY